MTPSDQKHAKLRTNLARCNVHTLNYDHKWPTGMYTRKITSIYACPSTPCEHENLYESISATLRTNVKMHKYDDSSEEFIVKMHSKCLFENATGFSSREFAFSRHKNAFHMHFYECFCDTKKHEKKLYEFETRKMCVGPPRFLAI